MQIKISWLLKKPTALDLHCLQRQGISGFCRTRDKEEYLVIILGYFFLFITKTCLYNFDPLKPHFYIVKLGFTGVYIICLISAQNIDCGYLLELPHWGGSNEYPQSMFWVELWKISEFFYLKIFIFFVVKLSVYLNRHVFVMSLKKRMLWVLIRSA